MPDQVPSPQQRSHPTPLGGVGVTSAVRIGAWVWVAAVLLFLGAQLVAGWAWDRPYSWSGNNISDLGNVHCGPWGEDRRYVCSPLHGLMNAAFVGTGLLVVAGVVLLWRCRLLGRGRAGRLLVALAAVGYAVAGLAPADVHENVHVVLGAVPIFFAGNVGLLLLALTRGPVLRAVRVVGLLMGGLGLSAVVLFLRHEFLGLGMGGMERAAALPLHGYLLLTGLLLVSRRQDQERPFGGARRRGERRAARQS